MKTVYKCEYCDIWSEEERLIKSHEEECGYIPKNKIADEAELRVELETWKKIAEKLAEKKVVGCINCTVSCVSDEDIDTYIINEIDWARNEVKND